MAVGSCINTLVSNTKRRLPLILIPYHRARPSSLNNEVTRVLDDLVIRHVTHSTFTKKL